MTSTTRLEVISGADPMERFKIHVPTALTLSPEDLAEMRRIEAHALAHKMPFGVVRKMADDVLPDPERYPIFRISIGDDLWVTFTIEQHPESWMAHLTIAHRSGDSAPEPAVGLMLAAGFEPGITADDISIFADARRPPGIHVYYGVDFETTGQD